MEHKPPLRAGGYYHVLNRGLDKMTMFHCEEDIEHFISLMLIYLVPVSDIYAYALMRNHFHLAIRMKEVEEIGWLNPRNRWHKNPAVKWSTSFDPSITSVIRPDSEKMVQHLFSSYAKWYNTRYGRSGKLLEERFERKPVTDDNYLRGLICYINRNPIKHRVCRKLEDYQWTSYHALSSSSSTWLAREKVMELFDGEENFQLAMRRIELDDWLEDRW